MTEYTASLYEFRDAEIEAAKEIRKRNRRELVEAILGIPVMIAAFITLLFV